MSLALKTTTKPEDAARFMAVSIVRELGLGRRVLLFVPGGSGIPVAVKVADMLREHPHHNLTVMLTDERYGPLNHSDSNFFQLKDRGFDLPEAKFIPVLTGEDPGATTQAWNQALERELKTAEYKIGLFGVGADGHTAGMLPESPALLSPDLAYYYDTPVFSRITLTQRAIEMLDEAVLWAQGENKWPVIKSLAEDGGQNGELLKQPVQALKKIPLLTIFTDYHI